MKLVFKAFLLSLILVSCNAQQKENLDHMTPDLWAEDLDYVSTMIEREFATFNPEVKTLFPENTLQLKEELNALSNEQIAIKVGQLLASLQDGHTEMSILQSGANLNRIPLIMYYYEDGLHIIAAHKSYQDLIGMRVKKIGSLDIDDSVEALKEVMTYDNDYEILHAGPRFLVIPDVLKFLGAIPSSSEATLMLEDETGNEIESKLSSISLTDYNTGPWDSLYTIEKLEPLMYNKNRDKNYWYEYVDESKTMYFYLGRVNSQKGQSSLKKVISNMFDEIDELKVEKLVVDIRKNSGGNYNKSRPLVDGIKKRDWLNKEGKVFVLNGRTTFSAAMVTSIFLKRETETILVGEPSRGHPNKCDNNEYMTMPNSGLSIEYTTRVDYHWEELGDTKWVPIDVKIPPRFEDYKIGKDAALQYALDY